MPSKAANIKSYFLLVCQKIKNNIAKYTDRCYKTAQAMFIYFVKKYNPSHDKLTIQTEADLTKFFQILNQNQYMLLVVEFHAWTTDKFSMEEKHDLMTKHKIEFIPRTFTGYAFRKEQIRYINHAINVLILNDEILMAQSWDGLQPYHTYTLSKARSKESLQSWLKEMLELLRTYPKNFFDQFDPNTVYDTYGKTVVIPNNERIVEMVYKEGFPHEFKLEVYYMIL